MSSLLIQLPSARRLLAAFLIIAGLDCIPAHASSLAVNAAEDPVEQALKLANQGNVDSAIKLLRDHLGRASKDGKARELLGRILDFDGRPDEAVAVWESGLAGTAFDFPLLMAIGEIRLRQGTDGPNVAMRRGMVGFTPSKDKAGDERFKREHLAMAATAYEKARELRPDLPDVAKALASVYSLQERHKEAVAVWESLLKLEPRDGSNHLELALALRKGGQEDQALEHLKKALELDPRLAEAHEALAELQQRKGQTADAALSQKRAGFYKSLPAFCTLEYSEENLKTLTDLEQEAVVRKLVNDPSERAAEFLAALCWSHPHNELETRAFQSLEARGAGTTPLLERLLKNAGSTCTIRSTAHILAKRKAANLYDYLEKMLPGDLRGFGMDMDIAGSLDDLGDPRAVGPLSQLLGPLGADAAQENGPMVDRPQARARAALALGAFDTPEVRKTLETRLQDPRLGPYCHAALYRITRNQEHLTALKKAAGDDPGFLGYVVGDYLVRKVGTEEAKALARKWAEQREAAEKAEKQKQREAAAKDRQSP